LQKSGVDVIVGIGEGVIEGVDGVRLGAIVAVAIGIGVMFPQAPIRNRTRIIEGTFNTHFNRVIDNSISNRKHYDN
jgi:hypothetical protein